MRILNTSIWAWLLVIVVVSFVTRVALNAMSADRGKITTLTLVGVGMMIALPILLYLLQPREEAEDPPDDEKSDSSTDAD